MGNLLTKTFDDWNGVTRTVTNSYDSATNRLTSTADTANSFNSSYDFEYNDNRGNVTKTGGLTFTYDMADQPTSMNGVAPNTGTSVIGSYVYDGNLKRAKTIVNGITRYNVYDHQGRLVHVEEGDGNYVSETNYLHGAGMTLARIKDGVFTYMHPDYLGPPQAGTDTTGAVEWNEYYTPFGETLISAAANDNQSGFTGHIKDADTRLNYMQARYYDPNSARFLSVDPVTLLESGNPANFNRYSYAFNDPVNLIDPDGNHPAIARKVIQKVVTKSLKKRLLSSTQIPEFALDVALSGGDPSELGNAVGNLIAGKISKAKRVKQLAKNRAQGKKGEALTEAKLGDELGGKQITLESSKGTKARVDFMKKDRSVVETKTGNASLSSNQQDAFDDINAGRPVIPRGANAEAAGLKPGIPIKLPSCSIDRPC